MCFTVAGREKKKSNPLVLQYNPPFLTTINTQNNFFFYIWEKSKSPHLDWNKISQKISQLKKFCNTSFSFFLFFPLFDQTSIIHIAFEAFSTSSMALGQSSSNPNSPQKSSDSSAFQWPPATAPSPSSAGSSDISVKEIIDKYHPNNNELLKHALIAKSEEDKVHLLWFIITSKKKC